MDNNSKDPLFKEYLRDCERLRELRDIEMNQGWKELETPYKRGYIKCFDLRDDIKRRDDVWIFYKCLELINKAVWFADKKFIKKTRKGKYEDIFPDKGTINEKVYEDLHPRVKKYFFKVVKSIWRIEYHCSLTFEFTFKIKPHMITHYKIHDELIEQEYAEIDRRMLYKYYKFQYTWMNSVGEYATIRNRKDRSYNKSALTRNLKYQDFDRYEYRYNHKHSAKWDAW